MIATALLLSCFEENMRPPSPRKRNEAPRTCPQIYQTTNCQHSTTNTAPTSSSHRSGANPTAVGASSQELNFLALVKLHSHLGSTVRQRDMTANQRGT